jgi:hypothetical protein
MKIARSILVSTCVLAAAVAAQAQGQPKAFVQVLTVHTKPEAAVDYEAFIKKVIAAGDKIGQSQRTITYQVVTGGPGYTYMIATYFDKWADVDSMLSTSEILTKALGEIEGPRALRLGRTSIESTESVVYRLLPDLSTKPRAYDPQPEYLQLMRTHVKPESAREWETVIGRYKAAAEQIAEAPTAIRRASVVGPANLYLTSSPFSKYAERDAWPSFMDVLKKAYGEEEARSLDQRRRNSIESAETFVLKYRSDLSRLGK